MWTKTLGRKIRGSSHQILPKYNNKFSFSTSLNVTPIAEVSVDNNNNFTTDEALADSIRPFFTKKIPVVLRGAVAHHVAMHRWNGERMNETFTTELPSNQVGAVEIGGSYSNTNMERAEIPFHDYLQYLQMFEDRHGREGSSDVWKIPDDISSEEIVYMAQNDLPDPLYQDIQIPKFCEDETFQIGHGRLYSVMLWLGPRAATSPLHFDPLDNCLMQFAGRKVVWLFDPKGGSTNDLNEKMMWHYAGHEGLQSNTSPVNPEGYDYEKYPLFAQYGPSSIRCILEPGDMLYIPSKWWHFVRSVDTAVSVNVWWR